MKKILINGHLFVLILFLFSLHGYSQTRDNAGILGTVTIDEKGHVTVQSFGEQGNKATKGSQQTGNSPVRLIKQSETVKPAARTEKSGLQHVLNDVAFAGSVYPVPPETSPYSSTEAAKMSLENATITKLPKSSGAISLSSNEAISGDQNGLKSIETMLEYSLNSKSAVLSNEGSYPETRSLTGTMADPNLTLQPGSSNITVTETSINLGLTVINNGTVSATASEIGYYLSSDILMNTTPNYLIGTDAVPALAAGATSAETHSVNVAFSSVPCGTYYVFFCIDHLKQVTESNENDNDWYFTSPKVTVPCVPNLDLATGSSSLTVDGTSVTLSVTAINNGSTTAAASVLGYYLSPDVSYTTTPNYLIGTDAVSSLAIGATSAETITVDVSASSVPCGTYYVFFVFDHLNQVTESNENDNIWYFTSPQVTIPCLPNLDLSSGSGSLTVDGTSLSIAATAINNGEATAAVSELGYYLSPDISFTTTPNYLIGKDAVSSLATGATSAETITVDVSAMAIPCGTYYVFFVFDHLNQVTESNENDNFWYFTSPTVNVPCVPNIDLASGTSSLAVDGTSVTISVTAINNGSTTAGASVLGYYLSPDVSYATTPNYLIGSDAISSLPVNAISPETITVDVSTASVPCGTYYVFFVFDHLNQVTESNEIDNIWYFTSPKVTIPCVPNLALSPGAASLSVNGTNISLAVTALNNGSTTAGASEVGYYLSPDIYLTTNPNYLIGTDAVPSLATGSTSNQTFARDVTTVYPQIPAGTYYVFFVFDHLKQVTESNEIDNEWYFTSPQVTIPVTCTLGVAPGNIAAKSSAGSARFTVTTPCDWTASSNQPWCTVTPSGTGDGTLTASFTANTSCVARTATITITVGGVRPVTVTITQEACTLSASPSSRSVAAIAGSTSFALSTICIWTASSNQTWCTLSLVSGTGNATITANCAANTTGIDRTATITFASSGCTSFNVTVNQEGCCLPTDHFIPAWANSSADFMNIYVTKAMYGLNNLEPGDEIGVFDGNLCVGAGKLITVIDNSHLLYIRASGNTGTGNGYTPGNPIVYRYWDQSAAREITGVTASYLNSNPEWSTSGTYIDASTSHIELTGLVTGLNDREISGSDIVLYPNPTDGKLYISSEKVLLKGAKVTVINSFGVVLFNKTIDTEKCTIDFTGNARGLYYLIIEGKSWSFTEKVVYK